MAKCRTSVHFALNTYKYCQLSRIITIRRYWHDAGFTNKSTAPILYNKSDTRTNISISLSLWPAQLGFTISRFIRCDS